MLVLHLGGLRMVVKELARSPGPLGAASSAKSDPHRSEGLAAGSHSLSRLLLLRRVARDFVRASDRDTRRALTEPVVAIRSRVVCGDGDWPRFDVRRRFETLHRRDPPERRARGLRSWFDRLDVCRLA